MKNQCFEKKYLKIFYKLTIAVYDLKYQIQIMVLEVVYGFFNICFSCGKFSLNTDLSYSILQKEKRK